MRLRGVAYRSDVLDIVRFFAQYNVSPLSARIGRFGDGRDTGDAFVVFPSRETREAALKEKHRNLLRGREVWLFRSCKERMDDSEKENATRTLLDVQIGKGKGRGKGGRGGLP